MSEKNDHPAYGCGAALMALGIIATPAVLLALLLSWIMSGSSVAQTLVWEEVAAPPGAPEGTQCWDHMGISVVCHFSEECP